MLIDAGAPCRREEAIHERLGSGFACHMLG